MGVLSAGLLLVGMLCAPVDWTKLSHGAVLVMAGLQQPENAAGFLSGQLASVPADSLSMSIAGKPNAAPVEGPESLPGGDATVYTSTNTVSTTPPPPEDGTGGKVYERQLDSGNTLPEGVAIQNRSGKSVDIATALATQLTCGFADTAEPQVLIIHTHTTEEYLPYDAGYYNAADRNRSADNPCGVKAVGEAVLRVLAGEGIVAVQDTTVHDAPQYSGAYNRSAKTVEAALKQYPSIKVVLDIHRDAIMEGDTGLVKPTVTIEGRKAAQMMLLVGVVGTAALPNPHWQQNLALAAQWQKSITDSYPGLMRPISTVASRYNQHLHCGYLLAEIGCEGNSIDEAVYSGEILGKTLAKLLKG